MAGGIHAAVVMCHLCTGRAVRTGEGLENDQYVCESCNRTLSIDWSYDGPPTEPCWPPTPEALAEANWVIARMREMQ